MKKLLLSIVVSGIATLSSYAQTESSSSTKETGKFSIGAEAGLPVGDASTLFSVVLGGSVKYEIPTAKHTYFTISVGYNNFVLKSEFSVLGPSSGVIPLKAGLKYYAADGFFLEGQAGVAIATASGGGSSFVYAAGLGYTFSSLEVGVRYEGWPKDGATTSQIGFRLAYRF